VLRLRLIAAACFIVPILLLIWADDRYTFGHEGIWLAPLAILASQMACAETLALMAAKNQPISRLAAHLASLAVLICASMPIAWVDYPSDCVLSKPGWSLLGIALAFCIVVIDEMIRYRGPGQSIARMANTMFVVSYAGMLMTFMLGLRMLEPSRKGLLAFMGTIIIVKLSDTGAYFTGRAIGKHKMSPILSPKKTWEGAVGGLAFACLGAAFVLFVLRPWFYSGNEAVVTRISWIVCCLYGISVTIAGMIGDLFESLLKRDAEVKDSSSWLPGLGGILDVLDSALAAAPVSFAWWVTGLLG
jgi:phosphatidate cytidylyltransferase